MSDDATARRVYTALAQHDGATIDALHRETSLPVKNIIDTLGELIRLGFVERRGYLFYTT